MLFIIVWVESNPPATTYHAAESKYTILSFLYASVDFIKSLSNKALAVPSPPIALPLSTTNMYSGFCSAKYSKVTCWPWLDSSIASSLFVIPNILNQI